MCRRIATAAEKFLIGRGNAEKFDIMFETNRLGQNDFSYKRMV